MRKAVLAPGSRVSYNTANVINTILMCKEMHTLPRAGGLYDQDSLFIYVLKNFMDWQAQRAELDGRKANVQTNPPGR